MLINFFYKESCRGSLYHTPIKQSRLHALNKTVIVKATNNTHSNIRIVGLLSDPESTVSIFFQEILKNPQKSITFIVNPGKSAQFYLALDNSRPSSTVIDTLTVSEIGTELSIENSKKTSYRFHFIPVGHNYVPRNKNIKSSVKQINGKELKIRNPYFRYFSQNQPSKTPVQQKTKKSQNQELNYSTNLPPELRIPTFAPHHLPAREEPVEVHDFSYYEMPTDLIMRDQKENFNPENQETL